MKDIILALEEKLRLAILENDVSTLRNLLHDHLLFLTPDGKTITKKEDLASHEARTMVAENIESEIESVNFIDHHTAITTLKYKTKGSMLGEPIEGTLKYIRTWKNTAGNWQVISGACLFV